MNTKKTKKHSVFIVTCFPNTNEKHYSFGTLLKVSATLDKIYRYRPKYLHISPKYQLSAKYRPKRKYRYRWPICRCKYIGINKNTSRENISVSAGPIVRVAFNCWLTANGNTLSQISCEISKYFETDKTDFSWKM